MKKHLSDIIGAIALVMVLLLAACDTEDAQVLVWLNVATFAACAILFIAKRIGHEAE